MNELITPARLDRGVLRERIQAKYSEVATEPQVGFHFHTGRPLAEMLGYDLAEVDRLPAGAVESFAGTGNPLGMGALRPAEVVLDLGCGTGLDTLLAARQVGPTGRVFAVDMTEAMLEKTRAIVDSLGLANIQVRRGHAEDIPLPDASVDIVISNGVINLCPDKVRVMSEVARVLRPGGRVQIADIVVHREVPQGAREDIDLWSGCIAGALLPAEWRWVLAHTGFTDVRWGREVDVFSGSRHESDAAAFGTRGVTFAAVRG